MQTQYQDEQLPQQGRIDAVAHVEIALAAAVDQVLPHRDCVAQRRRLLRVFEPDLGNHVRAGRRPARTVTPCAQLQLYLEYLR